MKVLLLVFLTFQWTKNTCGLYELVLENNEYFRDDTVVLDGAGVGSSANEHESHILFPNTAIPLTKDTTLKNSRETTNQLIKTKTLLTSKRSTFLTTEVNTHMNTITEKTALPTTEKKAVPTSGMIIQPTTITQLTKGIITQTTKGMITQPTTENNTLPMTGKVTMRTTKDSSLRTSSYMPLPTTEESATHTSSSTELTTVAAPATTTDPLTTVYRDCGTIGSHIKSGQLNAFKLKCARISSHRDCMLIRNTTARIFVNFTSTVDATKVKTIVHAFMDGHSYPTMFFFHLVVDDGAEGLRLIGFEEDACLHNNVDHCNIKAGEDVQYVYAAFINSRYPLLRMTLQLEIRDDQDRNLACIRFPIQIVI